MNRSVAGSEVTATPASAIRFASSVKAIHLHRRIFAAVPDRDPAAELVFLGQFANQLDVHVVRGVSGIEMHVDVDIEFPRQIEHAMDLPGMIGIEIRCRADHASALFQRRHQKRVGPRIVGQPFLREHAQLQVDGPCVIAFQGGDGLERAQFDAAIQFDMRTHARGAEFDAGFQGLAGTAIRILDGERVFDRRDPLHRHRRAACLGCATVGDA